MRSPIRLPSSRSIAVAAILGGLTGSPATADPVDWAHGCLPFIPLAEAHFQLPKGLLQAIALTESGQDGEPYPWALNIAGKAIMAESYQAAAGLLRLADGRPRQDVAIGCMQIHMHYHLAQFVEPEWALHPRYNVWYAAAFLDELRQRYGNWPTAIAQYHGREPSAQRNYLCRVTRHLRGIAPDTALALGLSLCTGVSRRPSPAASPRPAQTANRRSIMAARRVGRIIVLGSERLRTEP